MLHSDGRSSYASTGTIMILIDEGNIKIDEV